ncbi:MAG TPA: class I SAM-dependent methyltransferase [Actinomycetota bacterium]|nr:class I SAM-dependent methyltransferase [Actinomycetota bacterium]
MNDWEQEAENWVRWARAPGHDSYWYVRDEFFDQIVHSPGRLTLDLGCGEGRVTRDLQARGHRTVGLDASPTLVRYARTADPRGWYVVGDAGVLPFADATFDVVVAYNSLMDMDDLPGAVREAGRVLDRGGHLCLSVTHPLNDAGKFAGREPDAPFVIKESYFGRRRFEGIEERDDLRMTFRGWSYPLEDYASALEDAGFLIRRLREPRLNNAALERFGTSGHRWRRVPLFLQMLATKLP